jgi:hypothetical protein
VHHGAPIGEVLVLQPSLEYAELDQRVLLAFEHFNVPLPLKVVHHELEGMPVLAESDVQVQAPKSPQCPLVGGLGERRLARFADGTRRTLGVVFAGLETAHLAHNVEVAVPYGAVHVHQLVRKLR